MKMPPVRESASSLLTQGVRHLFPRVNYVLTMFSIKTIKVSQVKYTNLLWNFQVVVATLVSDLGKYESKYNLSVVGKITTGYDTQIKCCFLTFISCLDTVCGIHLFFFLVTPFCLFMLTFTCVVIPLFFPQLFCIVYPVSFKILLVVFFFSLQIFLLRFTLFNCLSCFFNSSIATLLVYCLGETSIYSSMNWAKRS